MPHALLTSLLEAQGRNVAGKMVRVQYVATVLLCLSIWQSRATSILETVASRSTTTIGIRDHHSAFVNTDYDSETIATSAALDTTHGGEIMGATSLAAAAGAAVAMASEKVASVGSNNVNSEVHNPLNTAATAESDIEVGPFDVIVDSRTGDINNYDAGGGTADTGTLTQTHGSNEIFSSSANLLLELTANIINLTRQHNGDIFRTMGVHTCNADTCVGLSSGTAGVDVLSVTGEKGGNSGATIHSTAGVDHFVRRPKFLKSNDRAVASEPTESCQCRCLPYLSTYREDLGICVDDVHECTLSPFVSGSASEKIPFVFLPLRGQIIYPSREISFPNIRTPVCAVTGAQYLTTNGWSDLRNPIDTDYPFRMFRDEGRTFLQWLGEPDLRHKMQGRLIVVHLVCRDMTISLNATSKDHMLPPKNVYSPCVAFRVNGTPVKYTHNVSEVLFQSETTSTLASTSDGMSTKEYVVIAVCSLLLGLIYVASVFLYLHMKKRKGRHQSPHTRNSLDDMNNEINYPKNDQVTFGAPFNRSGSIYSATSMGTSNEPRSRTSIGSLKEEMGIVKSNPLLQHYPQLSEHNSGFASDISNSNSECEMDGTLQEKLKQMQTSALVHPQLGGMGKLHNSSPNGSPKNAKDQSIAETTHEPPLSSSPTQETECLPVENVSIVEDMMTEEKLEHLRQMMNGSVRKKLYFNPAYFEPHLLAQPPPAAIEFLHKIREVIAIAKYKMATKRYQPSLIMIPEEGTQRSDTASLYGSNRQQSPSECQGCANNRCSGHVKNCGDKRNSIEKWLQTVTSNEGDGNSENTQTQPSSSANEQSQTNKAQPLEQLLSENIRRQSLSSSSPSLSGLSHSCSGQRGTLSKETTSPKQRPPPPPIPTDAADRIDNIKRHTVNSKPTAQGSSVSDIDIIKSTSSVSYQLYCSSVSTDNSVNTPVNNNYSKAFSALSAAASIYGFAETGSEIYNNPKFSLHDSPCSSQRGQDFASHRSKSNAVRKKSDVFDIYDPSSVSNSHCPAGHQQYDVMRNSLNREYIAAFNASTGFHLDIPTPDYDSTIEKKIKDIYNNTQSSVPSVPTPDYSTLSRKSLKQFQPDSPIYRRKSPQYLIVDYETDSLERLEATKRKSSQSSSSPSSDVSSQLSPSLSTALPLEEELEISHTVYDKSKGFRPEAGLKKKTLNKSDSDSSKQKEIAARIKYDTPFRGSMTIEVEHEPQSDIERSTDSDQFEPDTLDRKPKKQSFCDVNAWPGQALKKIQNGDQLNNYTSLPVMGLHETHNDMHGHQSPLMLRSSSSFRSQSSHGSGCFPAYESHVSPRTRELVNELNDERRPNINSLREIYQSPLVRQNSQSSCKCGGQYASAQELDLSNEQGRLLTLEAKQKRRQQIVESPVSPPPPTNIEISNAASNKTTIKISTPKVRRVAEAAVISPHVHSPKTTPPPPPKNFSVSSKSFYELTKHVKAPLTPMPTASRTPSPTPSSTLNSTTTSKASSSSLGENKRISRSPLPLPPPPPPSSASTTLTSQRSHASTRHSHHDHHYQNPNPLNRQHFVHHSTTSTNATTTATEEETTSNHSESTEITGVSDNLPNSEFDGSCNNTLSSVAHDEQTDKPNPTDSQEYLSSRVSFHNDKHLDSPPTKTKSKHIEDDYGTMFNTEINGLRGDYSLTKYMNRRKTVDPAEEDQICRKDIETQLETNNNINNAKICELDNSKLDLLSIGSRSNRSSSRLSDRTKELYRNAGVPVGIAYPQRSTASNSNSANSTPPPTAQPPISTIQTVYHCEIEPVQLSHGMQIAMGLKDRAKKAKDLKNAWKKFVSMAASKFSPTHSPAPPYDKKPLGFLEVLDRDEGISSLIDEHPRVSSPKSNYSAPTSHNYYGQRFGSRLQEMDSGYMSADSGEVHKRSFYDRYNFKKMSGRDRIIRIDTIEDNSDGDSTLTDRHNGMTASMRRGSILDSNRFEDFEHMGEPPEGEVALMRCNVTATQDSPEADSSDAESDKTLTQSSGAHLDTTHMDALNVYSSEEEEQRRDRKSPSYGSSETDGETNAEDMWESGAESIETHSVLYKNVRNS
ncbi:uncharacterized protein LOC105230656 [Bactrocera dorsalis]|uniref:Uncharacterized protein LOC105230656 n=1 Tax=Bactrocera dorsalis TaxID=27457 RepID=A0A8N4L5Q2_BACDO|nr:uncharacterized protein LOC105230656 [Bactrocera dorsalis]XP_049309719.1 uncharacterized protein LOC105230656 [Bactrocera dorsalis]